MCKKAIYFEDAIEEINKIYDHIKLIREKHPASPLGEYAMYLDIIEALKSLPSITESEQKRGKWKEMNDVISRKAAIDALTEMYCKSDEDGYVWIIRGDACLRIDVLPSAQSEQRWTPCSEKLPEEESEVLITTSWNDVCKAWYSNGKWRAEFINEYDDDEILAWMPLPEPWRGE